MSSDESESELLLQDNAIKHDTLPLKSKERYIAVYENFLMWQKSNNLNSFSEKILLEYFEEIATKYKPSTLWAMYSMIKCNLKCNHNLNMDDYQRVSAYLKTLSKGYKTKKVKGLSMENVEKFIDEAPDDKYLATKVALIFGVSGGLGRQQLCEVTTSDIENHGAVYLVRKPCTNKKFRGSFVIEGKYYNIVKKYQSLRTDKSPSNRFFQQFRDGKCRGQVIGINRFGMMPKEIAEFLNLPNANLYTGHCFRRVSRPVNVRIREKPEWWETVSINDSNSSSQTQPEPPSLSSRPQPKPPSLSSRTQPDPPSLRPSNRQEQMKPSIRQEQMRPSTRQDQKQNRGCQCRFCGEFKECTPVVQKPYLMGNKVSLALNHLRVELDFSIDSLPKTVCRDCDTKLLETFEFIKQVNTAQFSLVAVTQDTHGNNLAHTYTSNDFEFNTQIVKAEFDTDEENESQVVEDALTLSETVYLKETHKRKKKTDDKTQKKRKVKDKKEVTQNTELIIDIKEEIVDLDTNDELSDDLNDTGTDVKPDEEELAESEFFYLEGNNVNERQVKGKIKSSDRQCND